MIHAIIACVLVAALPAAAQPASPAATIADVAWLQGYWEGEGMGLRLKAKTSTDFGASSAKPI